MRRKTTSEGRAFGGVNGSPWGKKEGGKKRSKRGTGGADFVKGARVAAFDMGEERRMFRGEVTGETLAERLPGAPVEWLSSED